MSAEHSLVKQSCQPHRHRLVLGTRGWGHHEVTVDEFMAQAVVGKAGRQGRCARKGLEYVKE